jgi:nicotinamide mononucleotide transporter
MAVITWISNNFIEVFGAVTGIIYIFLEIRQTIWLWPVGIVTSAVYIWVFFTSKIYADMSLQVYYLIISVLGWYWWRKGTPVSRSYSEGGGHTASSEALEKEEDTENGSDISQNGTPFRGQGVKKQSGGQSMEWGKGRNGEGVKQELQVTRLKLKTGLVLVFVFVILYIAMWLILTRLTDSPVPVRDAFITSLSIVATWMLARKIYEHWYLWIVVNFVSAALFLARGLYPTVILYIVYGLMSFAGLIEWKKTIAHPLKF